MQDHVLIVDKKERVIFARLDPGCRPCLIACDSSSEKTFKCNVSGVRRRGVMHSELGSTYLCSSDPDLVSSSKSFRKQVSFFSEMLGNFSDIREGIRGEAVLETRRLVHNLTSLNAHILQELYLLVPQDEISKGQSTQLQSVKIVIEKHPKDAAKAFLKVLQNAAAMKTEFSVFTKLRSEKSELQSKPHRIHKVLLNIASFYFQDFQQNNVNLQLEETHNEILIDYETFSVSLHHIFSNAVKYIANSSELIIRFKLDSATFAIVFEMLSLPIYPDEISHLYEEGFSGRAALSLQKAGDGIGMGIVKQLLELNNGEIRINAGSPEKTSLGSTYARNLFEIIFPRSSVRIH